MESLHFVELGEKICQFGNFIYSNDNKSKRGCHFDRRGGKLALFSCYLFCCKVNSLYFIFKLILISFIIGSLLYDGISEEMGERKEEGRGRNRKRSIKYIFSPFEKIRYAHILVGFGEHTQLLMWIEK